MTVGSKKDYTIKILNINLIHIMKTKVILILALLGISFYNEMEAQAPDDCAITLSLFVEPAKAENYEAALPHYEQLIKECPKYSLAAYQYGERMFKYFIEKGDKGKVDDLIKMYKDRLLNFPEKTKEGDVMADIAQVKYDNNVGTKMEQFKAFDDAFKKDQDNFTSAKNIYTYFSLAVDLQGTGEKDLQEIFNLYDVIITKIEKEENDLAGKLTPIMDKQEAGTELDAKEKKYMDIYETNLKAYGQVKESVNGKLGQLADCPNLIPLYSKDFEAKKDDVQWIENAIARLDAKDCDDPLFYKLGARLHELKPSAESAYYLGKLAEAKGKSSEALEYFNQAADLQTDNSKKWRIYYSIAENFRKKGSYGSARTYYNKVLSVKPSEGRAYLKIAQMYAESSNQCGNTAFEKRAINWLAADMAEKAARVDASLAGTANSAAASYRARAPQKTDIFNDNMAGKTISFSNCWVGGSVRVPNL